MAIKFIQYLRPDGRKRTVWIDRPDEIERMAKFIEDKGYWFESELLSTGQASQTITDGEQDLAITVSANGPAVPVALDKMITEFYSSLIPA